MRSFTALVGSLVSSCKQECLHQVKSPGHGSVIIRSSTSIREKLPVPSSPKDGAGSGQRSAAARILMLSSPATTRFRAGGVAPLVVSLLLSIPLVDPRRKFSEAFEDEGDALADADAHGAESVAAVGAEELIEGGGDEARAAGAERVANGD